METGLKEVEVKVAVAGEDELEVPYKYLSPFDSEYSSVSQYFLEKPMGRQLPYRDIFLNPKLKDSSKSFRTLRHDVYDLVVGTRPETSFDLSILVCGETGVTQLEKQYGVPELPDMVRGYEHVKLANVERYREEMARLRSALT